jgi:hypothetical protein
MPTDGGRRGRRRPTSVRKDSRTVADLKKGSRITGADRNRLAGELKARYDQGASIRELASDTNRSYGFVHRMLSEAGARLRGRGGATRARKTA